MKFVGNWVLVGIVFAFCGGRGLFAQAIGRNESYIGGFCGTISRGTSEAGKLSSLVSKTLPPANIASEPTIIDLLILYTPQAVIGAGTEETLRTQILRNLDDANARFTNSRVNVQYHLVYLGLINYTESGDMGTDLDRLKNGSGELEQATTLIN